MEAIAIRLEAMACNLPRSLGRLGSLKLVPVLHRDVNIRWAPQGF